MGSVITVHTAQKGKMRVATATVTNAALSDTQMLADVTDKLLAALGKWVDDSRVAWETLTLPDNTLITIARYRYLP